MAGGGIFPAMGRHSTFDEEVAATICERLAQGVPLAEICRSEDMPAVRTVSDWRKANETFAADFARARDEGFDAIAADCLDIADDASRDTVHGEHGPHADTEWISRSKLRVETRLKLLAKWDPKRYGEKQQVDIGNADGKPFATSNEEAATKLAAIIAAGLARKAQDASDLV